MNDQEKLRVLYDLAPVAFQSLDQNGRLLWINEKWLQNTGYARHEVEGRPFKDFLSQKQSELFEDQLNSLKKNGVTENTYLQLKAKDGHIIHTIFNSKAVYDDQHRFSHSQCVFVDISDQKIAENQFIEHHRQLEKRITEERDLAQQYLDIVNSMIVAIDTEGVVLMLNRKGSEILGYAPNRLIGKNWADTIIPELERPHFHAVINSFKNGDLEHFEQVENQVLTKSGELRRILWHNTFIKNDQGKTVILLSSGEDITHQGKMQEQLAAHHQHYLSLFENNPVALFYEDVTQLYQRINMLKASGINDFGAYLDQNPSELMAFADLVRVQDVNKKAIALYHARDKQQLLNTTIIKFFSTDARQIFMKEIIAICEAKSTFRAESKSTKLDNTLFDISISLTIPPLYTKNPHLIVSAMDISEEKARERRIIESDTRYRALFENISDYVLVIDPSTFPPSIIDCNSAAYKNHGYTRDEFIGLPINKLMDIRNRQMLSNRLEQILKGDTIHFESLHLRKDGSSFNVEVTAKLIKLQNKKLIYTLERDITEKKQIEKELKTLSVGLQQSPVAVLITDLNGNIEYINPIFTKDSGYDWEMCQNIPPLFLKSEEHTDAFYKKIWTTILNGKWWHGEICNRNKKGSTYWVSATIGPIRNESGEIVKFIGFQNNISDRKILEQEFRQSQKMEAIGRLAGGVAHDFNNLLTVISGYGELTLMKLEKDHPARSAIEQISGAGKRAETLVGQLLAFSRKQIRSPKVVDINIIIGEMEKILRRLIGENIHFETHYATNLPMIKIDTGQLEQIVMNLLVNARDAVASDGQINLSTEITAVKAGEHLNKAAGDYVSFVVEDNGCGMDDDTQKHIFEPFFTTKGENKGTGLGLATVYGIVDQSGGFISIKSIVGIGTRFRISFPVVEIIKENHTENPKPDIATLRGNKTILVVEDDALIQKVLIDILTDFGYSTLKANNGKQALEIINDTPSFIDLVLSDVVMPEMNGTELKRRINNRYPDLKILLMTGYIDDNYLREEMPSSPDELLLKPIDPTYLLKKLKEQFREKQPR